MANNIYTAQKNVAAVGTPERLSAGQSVETDQSVVVKAKVTNTGTISIGNSSANAANGSTAHFKLAAGEGVELSVTDLSKVWIDSTVAGEGVEILIG